MEISSGKGRKIHESQPPGTEDWQGARRRWNEGILAKKKKITQEEAVTLKGRKADRLF